MKIYMISTDDNQWNPFDNRDEWRAYDIFEKKYCSESLLARQLELVGSDGLSDIELELVKSDVIDKLCETILAIAYDGTITKFIKVEKEI